MKKVLLSVLAVGMLTACSQDETVDVQAPSQIAFAGAFVNNVTRAADPSFSNENLPAKFSVWGYLENTNGTGQVFNDVTVTNNGGVWTYSPLQYWMPNNDYFFYALATNKAKDYKGEVSDETLAESGIGTIDFTNEDGTEDLLFATAKTKTGESITDAPEPVTFAFDHLLSKVKFTFTNGFSTGYSKLIVKNIRMYVPSVGTLTLPLDQPELGNYTWSLGAETPDDGARAITDEGTELDFGNILAGAQLEEGKSGESDNERLTIPADTDVPYKVLFDAVLYQDQVVAMEVTDQEATISGVELKSGYAYNFVAVLDESNFGSGLKAIEFEALVDEWVEPNDVGFVGVGGEIANDMILGTDVTATSKITLANGVTFDGNDYTMTLSGDPKDFYTPRTLRLIETTGNATIKNLTIDGNNTKYPYDGDNDGVIDNYGIRGIYMTGDGEVTIDNVTIKNVTYTLNTGSGIQKLTVKNSTLEGWTSYGASTTASFEYVKFECGTYANFKPYTSVTLTNCSFEEGFQIDFTALGTGVITLKNCTYNGTTITAENFATLVKVDGTPNVAF